MKDYYYLETWLAALNHLGEFTLLGIEFKKTAPGYVRQIRGIVFEKTERYIGGLKVTEKHPVTVTWRADGSCYTSSRERYPMFDLQEQLHSLC